MNGVVVEPALGEIVHAVAAFAGVEHVGDQHGVVVAVDLDAALREHQPVVFHVLRDLEDASVLEQRLERFQRVLFRDLVGGEVRREQVAVAAAVLRCGRAARSRLRSARPRARSRTDAGLHRIEAGGLGVDRDHADVIGARDPFLQARQRAHAFVFAAVDLGVARSLGARGGERDRGEGAVCLAARFRLAAAARTDRRFSRPAHVCALAAGAPDISFASASTCEASMLGSSRRRGG